MTVKSIQTLVSEAMQEIKTINADEAFKMVEDNNCNLIDIREARELEKTGSVENSVHISRGMMEIFLAPPARAAVMPLVGMAHAVGKTTNILPLSGHAVAATTAISIVFAHWFS